MSAQPLITLPSLLLAILVTAAHALACLGAGCALQRLIGAPHASPLGLYDAGESYVVFGKAGGDPVDLWDVRQGSGGFAIIGHAYGDYSGSSVSGPGDPTSSSSSASTLSPMRSTTLK